jgi:hypothetical protein
VHQVRTTRTVKLGVLIKLKRAGLPFPRRRVINPNSSTEIGAARGSEGRGGSSPNDLIRPFRIACFLTLCFTGRADGRATSSRGAKILLRQARSTAEEKVGTMPPAQKGSQKSSAALIGSSMPRRCAGRLNAAVGHFEPGRRRCLSSRQTPPTGSAYPRERTTTNAANVLQGRNYWSGYRLV